MKLRSYLIALALAAVLPLALFAAALGALVIEQQRETFHRGTEERVLAVSTAVDARLDGYIRTLSALALVKSLDLRELALFHATALQILTSQEDWITVNLALPSGQQVLNVLVSEGAALPPIAETAANLARLAEQGRPVIGDLVYGPTTKRWDFAARAPVVRNGKTIYILSAVVDPAAIGRLLAAQKLPADWEAAVLDPAGRIVARTTDRDSIRGEFAPQALRDALARALGGRFLDSTTSNHPYRVFLRSEITGWTVAMGIPASAVDGTAQRMVWTFALALVAVLVLALTLAHLLGRRISKPIAALASATDAMALGRTPEIAAASDIAEVRSLETALKAAVRAQEALRQTEEALREADRQKDEFVAMVGHELRSPLNALTAAARLLGDARQHESTRHSTAMMVQRQTRHMARVVEDLLDLTRLRMGKITLDCEMLDLAEVATEVIDEWRKAGRLEGRASVQSRLSPAWINADRARVEQVISNLLDNALKFTPPSGTVEVSVRWEHNAGTLCVTDSGRGIDAASVAHIFDAFMQGEHAGSAAERGLGLGLMIVRRLVELHGGAVVAESEGLERGASFIVRFPAVRDSRAVVDLQVVSVERQEAEKRDR